MHIYHPGYEGCVYTTRVMRDAYIPPGYSEVHIYHPGTVRCTYTTRIMRNVHYSHPGYEECALFSPGLMGAFWLYTTRVDGSMLAIHHPGIWAPYTPWVYGPPYTPCIWASLHTLGIPTILPYSLLTDVLR